jgi:hypothetical protein
MVGGQAIVENLELALEHTISWKVPNLANKIMIGCRRMHFDVRYHMYLHTLLKNLPMRVFHVTSLDFCAICENWKHQSLE